MNHERVSEDDVVAYLEGLVGDPAFVVSMEEAIEKDPELKKFVREYQSGIAPSKRFQSDARRMQHQFESSQFLPLPPNGEWRTMAPDRETRFKARVERDADRLLIRLQGDQNGWAPATVALLPQLALDFTPLKIERQNAPPLTRPAAEVELGSANQHSLSARSQEPPSAKTLSADSPQRWNSGDANDLGEGIRFYLTDTVAGIYLRCEADIESAPTGVFRFRLRLQAQDGAWDEACDGVVNRPIRSGNAWYAEYRTGVTLDALQSASAWVAEVEPGTLNDAQSIGLESLQVLSEDRAAILPLQPLPGVGNEHRYVAALRTERERELYGTGNLLLGCHPRSD